MAHPTKAKKEGGKTWHLEDSKLTEADAKALVRHLKFTEGKLAKMNKEGEEEECGNDNHENGNHENGRHGRGKHRNGNHGNGEKDWEVWWAKA